MGFHRWVGDVDFWVFNIEYSPLKMLPKRFSKKKLPLESHSMITRLAINTTWWNLVKRIALTLCYILLLCTVSPLAVLEFSRAEWRREPNLDFIGAHYKCEGKKCVVVMFSYYYGGGRS